MIKKFLYAGLVLLVIGVGVLFFVSQFITTGTPTNILNITVLSGRIGDVPVQVNASAISILFVFASNATNIYFLNQSAFSGLNAYLGSNSMRSAYSYIQSQNISKTDVFQDNSSAVKEEYQTAENKSTGSYNLYAVIDSTNGSPSYNQTISASVVYKSYSYGSWLSRSGEALVGIAAIILGIGLLIYGALKKPKVVAAEAAPVQKVESKKRKR
jgi:hypothetical protein